MSELPATFSSKTTAVKKQLFVHDTIFHVE